MYTLTIYNFKKDVIVAYILLLLQLYVVICTNDFLSFKCFQVLRVKDRDVFPILIVGNKSDLPNRQVIQILQSSKIPKL